MSQSRTGPVGTLFHPLWVQSITPPRYEEHQGRWHTRPPLLSSVKNLSWSYLHPVSWVLWLNWDMDDTIQEAQHNEPNLASCWEDKVSPPRFVRPPYTGCTLPSAATTLGFPIPCVFWLVGTDGPVKGKKWRGLCYIAWPASNTRLTPRNLRASSNHFPPVNTHGPILL